jgi:hypothetical protein
VNVGEPVTGTPTIGDVPPPTITIRLPTATPREAAGAPAFALDGPIERARVGLRTDLAWRSWTQIAGHWSEFLRRDRAEPVPIETHAQVGKEGATDRENIDAWADSIACGIVGLGTCGSCTSFTVQDSVAVEQHRKPVIAVVTSEFETHARNMARFLGHPDLKVLVLPYPLEARPDAELRRIAEDYYPRALDLLGARS